MALEIDPIYTHPIVQNSGEYVPEFDLTYYDDIPSSQIREIENVRARSWWESVKNTLVVEHSEVAASYVNLKTTLEGYMSEEDIAEVENAYLYAYFSHNFRSIDPHGRMRKNGRDHYTTHPIAVAQILADFGLRKETIISGLLHDTREDTFATSEEIYGLFGQVVGQNVEDVTKIHRSNKQETEALQIYKLYLGLKDIDQGGNPEAVVVKIADKLHNMRTLDGIKDKKRRKEIAHDAYRIYVPLAEKLGLTEIADELRYWSLLYTVRKVDAAVKRQDTWNQQIKNHAFPQLLNSLSQTQINPFEISVRRAPLNEFIKKRNQPTEQQRSADITLSYSSSEERDFWLDFIKRSFIGRRQPTRLSQGHWEFNKLPFGDTDWNITLLSTKKYELQKLSLLDRYKYGEKDPEEKRLLLKEKLGDIRDIIAKYERGDVEEFISTVTERLPFEQIVVMTPKGERVRLNEGSTAADFAYEIHQDFLPRAFGVRINGNESTQPINTQVSPGDKLAIELEPDWEFMDSNLLFNGGITNPSAIRHYKNSLITLIDRKKSEDHYYRALTESHLSSTNLEKKSALEESKIRARALIELSSIYEQAFHHKAEYDFSEMWDFVPDNFKTKFGSWNEFLYSLVLKDIQPRFIKNFIHGCEEYQKTHYDSKTIFVINQDGVIADFSTTLEQNGVGIIQFSREVNNASTPKGAAAIRILANPGKRSKDEVARIIFDLQKQYDPQLLNY